MSKIVAVTNQKGGVGKTTTTTALVTGLIRKGYKVLLIDNDPQCNSTDTFRALVHNQATLKDVLIDGEPIEEAIQHTEIGDIIAGDPLLADAEQQLAEMGREYRLKEALDTLPKDKYDFIFMDTPPNLGILLTNALTAADSCIIPISADKYALQGLADLGKTVNRVRKYTNPDLKIDGLVIVIDEPRTKLSREAKDVVPEVCAMLKTKCFKTSIRKTQAVKDAQKNRLSLFTYAPDCNAAKDYEAFIEEYLSEKEDN